MFDTLPRMALQRSFEDLGTPLKEVTFCVLDLETTGGSPAEHAITEIGACKVRMGEVQGTFQTLVDPGRPVPAFVRLLTGITDDVLAEAPGIGTVLPSLLEFIRGSVLVAHNARFDIGFLNAALARADYPPLANRVLDTATLARKIVGAEVPNCKLDTLARYLRCAHRPTHRAYADVLATIDVLHHLIERVAGFGVTTLEDLTAMSGSRIDGTFSKIRLTDDVPRSCGVYRFIGSNGETLYVGKATDLRARVRSYFYGDPRRKIRDLLRQVERIEVETYRTTLEAEVAEARAIARERPPHNRAGKSRGTWYLKAHVRAKAPKFSGARVPRDDGNVYLGPFTSLRTVRTLIEALQDASAIHRCSEPARCRGCAFSEMGSCVGDEAAVHTRAIEELVHALESDPDAVFGPLRDKMRRLAALQRFEEATETRERAASMERALETAAMVRSLVGGGDIVLGIGDRAVLIRAGQLAAAVDVEPDPSSVVSRLTMVAESQSVGDFVPTEVQREARVIWSWLRREADACRLIAVSGTWALPVHVGRTGRFAVREAA
jgi:DNA polymerase III subunit epsilon